MIRNYAKIALRNLRRHQVYTFINVTGLAVGVASCLLILLYVRHELSYDRFHENANQIVRVVVEQTVNGGAQATVNTPLPLAAALRNEFSEVQEAVRLGRAWEGVMRFGDKQFHEFRLFFADPELLEVFTLRFLRGDPKKALEVPDGLVLTAEMARKYFGDADPLGKIFTYIFEEPQEFQVTGVVQALPENSHFHFDFLAPLHSQRAFLDMMGRSWSFNFRPTYLLLSDETTAADLQPQLDGFVARYFPDKLAAETTLRLQPLTDIHLRSQLVGELDVNGSLISVYLFSGIAIVILLVACINFMNLATARSAGRAREVGLRKVLGAHRTNLIQQFLGEAVLLSAIAVLLAFGLTESFLPIFNDLTGKSLSLLDGEGLWLVGAAVVLCLLVGVSAGSYPAFFLSGFRPVQVLKGNWSPVDVGSRLNGALFFRKLLVTGQFAVSSFFLIAIAVMFDQLDYVRYKDLGFKKDQVLYIRTPQREEPMNFALFKQELLQARGVVAVTGAARIPGSGQTFSVSSVRGQDQEQEVRMPVVINWVEEDFVETFGLTISEGRDFDSRFATDPTEALIINEAAARELGWAEPVGKRLEVYRDDGRLYQAGRVVGVAKDFHFESLHSPIKPMVLTNLPVFNRTFVALKVHMDDLPNTLALIEERWKRLAPEWPLELLFLDKSIANLYQKEAELATIIGYFAALAIVVACLGLFGLAAFAAEQRTKEIGVRKVLGASVTKIVVLLTTDFTKLVMLAFLIAGPIAYYIMRRWLEDFAYRIEIHAGYFLSTALLILAITLGTIGFRAMKAAMTDPVKALRYE